MSDPRHSCPRCNCPSHGVGAYCDECAEDSEGLVATADERRTLCAYIGKVRDMHPLAVHEVTP